MADYEERKKSFQEFFATRRADHVPTYEGFSEYSDETEVVSFIEALRAAAFEAAKDEDGDGTSDDGVHLPAWFEVTRLRILVGNPNVKVLGATITASAPPSSDAE